jgi:hypothetical protein
VNEFSQRARGIFTGWFGNGPWRSKSVLAALVVIVAGLTFWVSDIKPKSPPVKIVQTSDPPKITPLDGHWNWSKQFPFYVRMGASYAAAYCTGWLFRRVLMLILVLSVLVITLLTFGKFIGLNTTHANEEMKQGSKWVRHTVSEEKDYLKGFLPSAIAGTAGMFMGFWRRNQVRVAKPAA